MDRKPDNAKNRTADESGAEPAPVRPHAEARKKRPEELSREEQEMLARENRLDGDNHFAPDEGSDGAGRSRSGPPRTAAEG